MPRKQINSFDLITDFSAKLRERSVSVGLDKYKPMDAQQEFHNCKVQGRIYSGGNRAGKTVAGGAEMCMLLTGKHPIFSEKFPPPFRGRVVAVDFDHGVNLVTMPEIRKWMPTDFLVNGRWDDSYHKASRVLTLTNGSTLEFMSCDQDMDKFAGTSRHGIWFDEEPPQNIFNECMTRLIDTNGIWWLTMTPLIDFSWTEEILYEPAKNGLIPNVRLWEVSTGDNTHIETGAIDNLLFALDADEKEARTQGTGVGQNTLIFPEFNRVVIPELDEEKWDTVRRHWKHFTMMDHGLRNPTAILFAAVGPDDDIIIYDEYYETGRLVHENAKYYKAIVKEKGIEVDYMVGDPSTQNTDPITGTSIRTEYMENGVFYLLGNNDVHAGLLRTKSMIQTNRLHVTQNCVKTIREARMYKWAKPISNKLQSRSNLMEKPVKKNDHAMDALRYGIMSLPKSEAELDADLINRLKGIFPVADTSKIFELASIGNEAHNYDEHLGLLE